MNTKITFPTETTVKITINVDKNELAEAREVALVRIAKDIKVPGFRKGSVPINVALKHIEPLKLNEAILNAAISNSVSKAFLDNNLKALDTPQVELKKYVPEEVLEFTAETEIIPKIKLGNYKNMKPKLIVTKVTQSEIDQVINRMLQGLSEKTAVQRSAKVGDEVIIDFIGKKDGVEFEGGASTDYPLILGSNSFIPGFEEGIVGKKIGETFDLNLKFPDDYHSKDLKGQPVVFTTTVKMINEHSKPELNDEFAAKVGPFSNVKELKEDIKRELTEQKKHEALEKFKEDLINELIETSTVPVPKLLVEDQAKILEKDFTSNFGYRGITLEQYLEAQKFKDKSEWYKKELEPAAIRRVQTGLILAELSKIEKIEASADELADNINKFREQYKTRPDIAKQFESIDAQKDLANRLITEKTINKLVELNSKK